MAGPFKMKGSPMARNFGAPFKDNDKVAGGKKSTEKIWNEANAEYLEKGSKAESEIKEKANTEVNKAVKYNKSRANYLKYAASIAPTPSQSAKSKGTLKGNTKFKSDINHTFRGGGAERYKRNIKKNLKKIYNYFTEE